MWSLALSFLKNYWKPVSIVFVAATILGYVYLKGRSDLRHKLEAEAAKETIHRIEEASKVRDRYKKVRDKIHEIQKDPDPTAVDDALTKLFSHPPASENP